MIGSVPERLEKLLRLAVDPGAAEGERINACTMFVRQVRAVGLTYADVIAALTPAVKPSRVVAASPASQSARASACSDGDGWGEDWWNVTMPFGKHSGETVGDILDDDSGYITWLHNNVEFSSDRLRDAVEEAWKRAT